ncbi:MAG: divergent PAP2 family protein, partial [Clostridia bacterium]|nr:divergent PAP2 family protein [Clostridia bacterium]
MDYYQAKQYIIQKNPTQKECLSVNWFFQLISNPYLITALSSWFIAQVLKVIINAIVSRKLDMTRLVGDGGMPSGHSATVT